MRRSARARTPGRVTAFSRLTSCQRHEARTKKFDDAVRELVRREQRREGLASSIAPRRLVGREQINGYLESAGRAPIRWDEFTDTTYHQTTDPEVLIVEYEAHGHVEPTGEPFHQSIIAVYRVRDGKIVLCRDYLDPLKLVTVAGTRGEAAPS